MRYSKNIFLALITVFGLGFLNPPAVFSWPFGAAKSKSAASTPAPASTSAPASKDSSEEKKSEEELAKEYAKQQVDAARRIETTAESVGVTADVPAAAVLPKTPRVPKFPKASDYNVSPNSLKATRIDTGMKGVNGYSSLKPSVAIKGQKFQTPVQGVPVVNFKTAKAAEDAEILKIQDQIKEIIKLNESLKTQYSGQSAEVQKIGEQAKIHQKILQDFQKTPAPPSAKAEELLKLEKIRVIKKETEENHRYIESLKESNAQQGTEKPASQKVTV